MHQRRIIKQGPVVFATREDGSMDPAAESSNGVFLGDTRYLSRLQIRLNDLEPVLLGSTEEVLFEASYLLTNQDMEGIEHRGIGVLGKHTIDEGVVRIGITVANWALHPIECELSVELDSDFYDSFEARGVKRLKRGETCAPQVTKDGVELKYIGLDHVTRTTQINPTVTMQRFENNRMFFPIKLDVNERSTVELHVRMMETAPKDVDLKYDPKMTEQPKPAWFDRCTDLMTSNHLVNQIIERSINDLEVLLTEYRGYWVPCAGLPRFAVPFGRDAIFTSLQTLVWNPEIARSVLYFLAETQGKEENPWNYEQPGKIMHEMHTGELARLKEIPFGLFYGTVDSTPLFLVLAGEYIRWTGDVKLYKQLKPHFEAAWKWIDDYGDIDGSGYVQYKAHTPPKMSSAALTVGLFNQGWKDSANSVVYSDGTIVTDHPISLAEVQGDLYRALEIWAEVYATLPDGLADEEKARSLRRRQAKLHEQFNREFWMPEKNYYAMALDGDHRHVDSITSNPAECLWSRLVADEHADAVAKTILSDSMFGGWGIRTMANTEKAYNPFSYHNGSVWPFENALIASGLKKYGLVHETQAVFEAMVDAALYFEYRRWPEVYCGVGQNTGGVLARQPDACRPQAWSAGAIFMLLQTILGIAPQPFSNRVDLTPALPTGISEIQVDRIPILGTHLGLRLVRQDTSVLLEITENKDDLDVIVHPPTRNHRRMPVEPPAGANAPAVSR